MGIYIKGLKAPASCCKCRFSRWSNYGQCYMCNVCEKPVAKLSSVYESTKPDWCPIVEIPVHGRLIDADAYCEDLLEEAHRVWGLLKPETIERINRTVDDLKNYPAVVEAEWSENHDD